MGKLATCVHLFLRSSDGHQPPRPLAKSILRELYTLPRGCAIDEAGLLRVYFVLLCPHRLVAQDTWFSARRPGFESPWGYQP